MLDDTIFVFSSDNGFLLGEHGMIDKGTLHEASIRVPLDEGIKLELPEESIR